VGPERTNHQYPIRSLVEEGALLIAGSDWPAAVPSANPWPGIEAMVTREHPYGAATGALWKEQGIELETVLEIYTLNGARAVGEDDIRGSIAVGKSADMVVLDRNLFEIPAQDISDTQVRQTLVNGRVVYQQDKEQTGASQ
jgi:predicted amidohydrolase YtcJ